MPNATLAVKWGTLFPRLLLFRLLRDILTKGHLVQGHCAFPMDDIGWFLLTMMMMIRAYRPIQMMQITLLMTNCKYILHFQALEYIFVEREMTKRQPTIYFFFWRSVLLDRFNTAIAPAFFALCHFFCSSVSVLGQLSDDRVTLSLVFLSFSAFHFPSSYVYSFPTDAESGLSSLCTVARGSKFWDPTRPAEIVTRPNPTR